MTKPLRTAELEHIMTEALTELLHQAQRAQGVRNAEHTRRLADAHASGPRSGLAATGPRSTGVNDPTGTAATNPPDDSDRTRDELADAWRKLRDDLRRIRNLTAGIHSHAAHTDRNTHSQVRLCAVPWCRDDILPDQSGQYPPRGRCQPCADYNDRHGEDPGPATVDARRRKRDQRERQAV